uniref:Aminomethyltransferase folate-binding domain-containing protein n=1 Tax=Corethron hystrix TaxID=216773 RepID=A0A7S1B677_9STRA|mmetsp:Transcript_14319/g.31344  ORF Transcript_14319/g.31344 Transcript_14319/m.31344 type:complete len:553 (+) Transcript_14319:168-1826(+)
MNKAAAGSVAGRLWSRGHEILLGRSSSENRRHLLRVCGPDAASFLQGLVTCDMLAERKPLSNAVKSSDGGVDTTTPRKLQSATFLTSKGRILSDALLWRDIPSGIAGHGKDGKEGECILIELPGTSAADEVANHLKQYKLRRTKVDVKDVSSSSDGDPELSLTCIYGTLLAKGDSPRSDDLAVSLDPRHPSLGVRAISSRPGGISSAIDKSAFPESNGTYEVLRLLSGVAEGGEVAGRMPLECNLDLYRNFSAAVSPDTDAKTGGGEEDEMISFSKGCYLGQETTARAFHKGVVRKRILPIILLEDGGECEDVETPGLWLAAVDVAREAVRRQKEAEDEAKIDIEEQSSVDNEEEDLEDEEYEDDDDEYEDDDYEDDEYEQDEYEGKFSNDKIEPFVPPLPLPRLSSSDAAIAMQLLQERSRSDMPDNADDKEDHLSSVSKLAAEKAFISVPTGSKIYWASTPSSTKSKAIGEVVAGPLSGTTAILAMMRLDEIMDVKKWDIRDGSNKVQIVRPKSSANENEDNISTTWRIFPYIPLWWPKRFDVIKGKEVR